MYPEIAKRARAEGGKIHWGDETVLVNTDVRGCSFAPKGKTPVAYAPGTRKRLSMIATVTNNAVRIGRLSMETLTRIDLLSFSNY